MSSFEKSWIHDTNTSNISVTIKKHIKHGHHRSKYTFTNDPVSLKLE